jgi:uncharacterized repeat protein (TIGR03843 family)
MPISDESILATLQHGTLTLRGEFVWGSNYTFLTEVQHAGITLAAVYKPTRGQRPLWDFPTHSLAHREVAAYLVSQATGWNLVPPTVYRSQGPTGAGSLQLFIEHDPEHHYFKLNLDDRQGLQPVVLFDLLVNNADRKGSHLLFDSNHHLWLIDHGLCFHEDDKLRTVIWDFAGEAIPEALLSDLRRFRQTLEPPLEAVAALEKHISPAEIQALSARADQLLEERHFPDPPEGRRSVPWPPV